MAFQLPPFLIQSFYKDVLFDFTKEPEILGNYEKQILILVKNDGNEIINGEDFDFLTNILKACSLNIKDIRILNVNNNQMLPTQIIPGLQPKKVIFFGIDKSTFNLPLEFPDFQVQPFDGVVFLSAPALIEISNSAEIKKNLWQSLKKMFL